MWCGVVWSVAGRGDGRGLDGNAPTPTVRAHRVRVEVRQKRVRVDLAVSICESDRLGSGLEPFNIYEIGIFTASGDGDGPRASEPVKVCR